MLGDHWNTLRSMAHYTRDHRKRPEFSTAKGWRVGIYSADGQWRTWAMPRQMVRVCPHSSTHTPEIGRGSNSTHASLQKLRATRSQNQKPAIRSPDADFPQSQARRCVPKMLQTKESTLCPTRSWWSEYNSYIRTIFRTVVIGHYRNTSMCTVFSLCNVKGLQYSKVLVERAAGRYQCWCTMLLVHWCSLPSN